MVQDIEKIVFLIISDHQGNSVEQGYVVRAGLGQAAGYDNSSGGIGAVGASDQLSGLRIRIGGHCAGINDVNVRRRIKRNNFASLLFEVFRDCSRVALIDLAAQCGNSDTKYFLRGGHIEIKHPVCDEIVIYLCVGAVFVKMKQNVDFKVKIS